MTVIVGIIAPNGDIFMGSDSAGTSMDGSQSIYVNKKVFAPVHGPAYLIGVCGNHRLSQVMRYAFVPPPPPGPDVDLERFMASEFVNSVRECYRENGILTSTDDGADTGSFGSFLVGYQGRLFEMEENFQILIDRRNYMSVGSGEDVAHGALYATDKSDADPAERVMIALRAAVNFNAWCREPLEILRLPFDQSWHRAEAQAKKKPRGKKASAKSK
jgi:hypothetical protein